MLIGSLIFYAWGERSFILLFMAQCVSAWAFGFAIDKYRGKPAGKVFLIISSAVSLSGLFIFKYADFFISNINGLLGANIGLLKLTLPIGVSFYTFQILSYTIDLYRGGITLQRGLIDFSAYVAMFPQLIAGPIVRYSQVAAELAARTHNFERFAKGARRFTAGLGKKVLIANVLGELVALYKNSGDTSALFAWMYMLAFALHIYFDFSGYSDMAIGIGHMLGFKFPENFRYPYAALGVTDFWRRWHISLSGWFRDYVYIPLGGSRVKAERYMNLAQSLFCAGAVFSPVITNLLIVEHGLTWRVSFFIAACGVAALTPALFLTPFARPEHTAKPKESGTRAFLLAPFIVLLLMIFLYGGIETGAASYMDSLFTLGLAAPETGAYALSLFWLAMMLSRILFGCLQADADKLIWMGYAGAAIGIVILAMSKDAGLSLSAAGIIGFAMGPLWSAMIALAARWRPSRSGLAVTLMSAAAGSGGALFPLGLGFFLEHAGVSAVFWAVALAAAMAAVTALLKGAIAK